MNNAKEERVTDLSIIMEMIDGKPYYSVQYRNVGENGYNIGYSSYDLKTVLELNILRLWKMTNRPMPTE